MDQANCLHSRLSLTLLCVNAIFDDNKSTFPNSGPVLILKLTPVGFAHSHIKKREHLEKWELLDLLLKLACYK